MVSSWGNYPKYTNIERKYVFWQDQKDLFDRLPVLPYGQGRSYGDSCLNEGGVVLDTSHLNRFMAFNPETGILRCEAGVTLAEINQLTIPQGWMLPVVPGTQFVSVGGAMANDVHGKNHHRVGTFGCHVRQLELVRSAGEHKLCSRQHNTELFRATIGGLGLTGLILWAEIQLRPVDSAFMSVDTLSFESLSEFLTLARESEAQFEYTVAWLDCQAPLEKLGRGIFMRANHASALAAQQGQTPRAKTRAVPFYFPNWALNSVSMRLFNQIYYAENKDKGCEQIVHYQPFFFPLDSLTQWNRIYGKRGFLQYQCVIPWASALSVLTEMVERIVRSRQGSFLSVLKTFGDIESPGLLSFPMPGVTLALDFPNQGLKTFELLDQLDGLLADAGGRLYPAKDARMSADLFQQGYPQVREFERWRDLGMRSSFWNRVCIQ